PAHQFRGVGAFGLGEAGNAARTLAVLDQCIDIDSVFVVKRAIDFNDANDFVTCIRHQLGGVRADVAEALHDYAGTFGLQSQFFYRLIADDHDSAAGGFAAAARSPDIDRLSGHD